MVKSRITLTVKILLLALLNVTLLVVVSLLFMRLQLRVDLQSFLISPAQDRILSVARQIGLELGETERSEWDALLQRYSTMHGVEVRLFDDGGRQLAGPKANIPAAIAERLLRGANHHGPGREEGYGPPRRRGRPLVLLGISGSPSRHWVGVPIPLPGEDGGKRGRGLVVVASSWGSLFFFDPKPWLFAAGAVLLLSALCWLPFLRGITLSVAKMTDATGQIAEGQFDIQLPATRRDELGQLSASINSMAARLGRLITGQKRFLDDAAHELCSPLARMQVELGILERSATPEQAQVVADLKEDTTEMSALVNDLLAFSKAGLRAREVRLETVSVAEMAARAIGREVPADVPAVCSATSELHVVADPDLLLRALSNVIRNAVRYAGSAGPIEVIAQREGADTVIYVRDRGPGLAAKDLEAVFEPFYRPEAARTREGGGAGLGLAIVRTCVEACQGTVRCRNRTPSGLEVEMRLKTAAAPDTISGNGASCSGKIRSPKP
ncbi:MAG: HAMP domain-containing sensor histidine kinase [Bryobacteraceae bacterium]